MFKNLSRADIRFLVALLVVHAVYFAIAVHYKRIYNGDSYEYIYMATNILDKGWFYAGNPALPVQPEYMTLRPPGYPLFLAGIYLFTLNNWVVLVIQTLISIANVYFMRHIMRMINYSRKYDWVLLAFVLLYPSQCINANIIAPDLLLQTTILAYAYNFIRLLRQRRMRFAVGMGIALCAGVMLKPVVHPIIYVHALLMMLAGIYVYKALLRSFVAAMLPLLLVVTYGYVNYARTGKVHFSSMQSFNAIFYYYNYYKDTEGVDKAEAFLQEERAKIAAMPTFAERYDYANKRGRELLLQNFGSYMVYHIKHSLRLLVDPGKGEIDLFTGRLTLGTLYDVYNTEGFYDTYRTSGIDGLEAYVARNPSLPIAVMVMMFNVLRTIGMLLYFFNKQTNYRLRLFMFLLIAYFVMITGPIANTRYFMPVSLLSMGIAAIGYQRVLQRLKNKAIIAGLERQESYH